MTINKPQAHTHKALFMQGFTLVELLVVILIVGILVSVVIASFGSAQRKSRDARRKGDLDALKKALEIQKSNSPGGRYYGNTLAGLLGATINYIDPPIPTDPSSNQAYAYHPGSGLVADCTGGPNPNTCTDYRLIAILENTNDPLIAASQARCPVPAVGTYNPPVPNPYDPPPPPPLDSYVICPD